jgi:hypothetical protein
VTSSGASSRRRRSGAGATGYRSAIAASLLQRDGRTDVADLVGGMAAWEAAGTVS